jgi:Fur family peroxide stress response transcriptional regulator
MAQKLRDHGLRATGPRLAILETLGDDRSHPTPEQIHTSVRDRYPTLSLSTVYQTLEAFLGAGLCRRVTTRDGRLRVDGTTHDHDHAVCRSCGSIFDLERSVALDLPTPSGLPRGMRVKGVRVEYDVVCSDCEPGMTGSAAG